MLINPDKIGVSFVKIFALEITALIIIITLLITIPSNNV